MNIFEYAAAQEFAFNAMIKEMSGYECFTTFWSDFTIADKVGGAEAVKDTYNRVKKAWSKDVKYWTELTLVLNHKCWYYYQQEKNIELSKLYGDLYHKAYEIGCKNFKGKDFSYFYNTLD